MLSSRVVRVTALRGSPSATLRQRFVPVIQQRSFWPDSMGSPEQYEKRYPLPKTFTEEEDPHMNGGHKYPPPVKTQFRDPYGDWWDKQERRNFGEPVHEDYDTLGALSPHEYTWTTMDKAWKQSASAVIAFFAVIGVVYMLYPDRPSYPKEYEGGLERELGGPGALRARKEGDDDP